MQIEPGTYESRPHNIPYKEWPIHRRVIVQEDGWIYLEFSPKYKWTTENFLQVNDLGPRVDLNKNKSKK